MNRKVAGIFIMFLGATLTGYFLANPATSVTGSQQPHDLTKSGTQSDRGPLIETIYQASRAENSKDSMLLLEQARDLIDQGADVKSKDTELRTPLHWAVIGAIYA